jgi:hypothetical protein
MFFRQTMHRSAAPEPEDPFDKAVEQMRSMFMFMLPEFVAEPMDCLFNEQELHRLDPQFSQDLDDLLKRMVMFGFDKYPQRSEDGEG